MECALKTYHDKEKQVRHVPALFGQPDLDRVLGLASMIFDPVLAQANLIREGAERQRTDELRRKEQQVAALLGGVRTMDD